MKNIETKEPFLRNKIGKLEIMVDVELSSSSNHISILTSRTYSNSLNSIVLKFNNVKVDGGSVTISESGPVSLTFCNDGEDIEILQNLLKSYIPQDNNLPFGFNIVADPYNIMADLSLECLKYFNNLIHLDLSSTMMNGRLNFLKHMNRGLIFLSLCDTDITTTDLGELLGTCHVDTLRELNLSFNNWDLFDNDGSSATSNLIELCKNLTNILFLNLHLCQLGSWPRNDLQMLFHLFKSLPKIIYLNLRGNSFSYDSIKSMSMILKENLKIRYLDISYPHSISENDANIFDSEINHVIRNENRSHLMYVEFSSETDPYNSNSGIDIDSYSDSDSNRDLP